MLNDDPELLAAFREGRRAALEQVYRTHCRAVERYLHALARSLGAGDVRQPSVISDLLQEVFARAFSAPARQAYDGLRDYGRYLASIARYCFIDAVRARRREVPMDPGHLPSDLDATPEPDDGYDPRVLAVLTAYVTELPQPLRALYEQRFVLDRSQEEASAALGISRRALRTGEQRLRKGLRKALARRNISLRELGGDLRRPTGAALVTVPTPPSPALAQRGRS